VTIHTDPSGAAPLSAGIPPDFRPKDFPVPSLEDWRSEVDRLLKGASFETRMRTRTPEGITVRPLYRREDVVDLDHLASFPGLAPFVRGNDAAPRLEGWEIAPRVEGPDPGVAAARIRRELAGGATGISLGVDEAEPDDLRAGDLGVVLADVELAEIPVHLEAGVGSLTSLERLLEVAERGSVDGEALRGSASADPLGALAARGALPVPLSAAWDRMAEVARRAAMNAPALTIARADGGPYHDGGADAVQELAFALATAVVTLRELDARGLAPEVIAPRLRLGLSVGSRFFFEIAKLRAARLLVHRVLEVCGLPPAARRLRIHASTSRATKTVTDPHVNLLRTTTEALAAVIGGADVLHVAPFDAVKGTDDELSQRLARNLPIVLRDEAGLARVADPAGGSWCVERLTADLAEAAWSLFRGIERDGGMARALTAGWPQAKVAETAVARAADYATRRSVLVGTNKYPNASEDPLAPPAVRAAATGPPAEDAAPGAVPAPVTVVAVSVRRFGEPFEILRRRVERHREDRGGPRVFLATLGPAARYMPRLDFAASLFEVGGFPVQRTAGHDSPAEAARAAIASKAEIVVVCGLDSAYEEGASAVARAVKEARPEAVVVLAGLPAEEDRRRALEDAGIDRFLHAESDVLEVLTGLCERLDVSPEVRS
jgi:methylmalonyl-CoA mutase